MMIPSEISITYDLFSLTSIEPPRRVDDEDSQTKKKIIVFGKFYCTVVPTISNPLLRMFIAAFKSRS